MIAALKTSNTSLASKQRRCLYLSRRYVLSSCGGARGGSHKVRSPMVNIAHFLNFGASPTTVPRTR